MANFTIANEETLRNKLRSWINSNDPFVASVGNGALALAGKTFTEQELREEIDKIARRARQPIITKNGTIEWAENQLFSTLTKP